MRSQGIHEDIALVVRSIPPQESRSAYCLLGLLASGLREGRERQGATRVSCGDSRASLSLAVPTLRRGLGSTRPCCWCHEQDDRQPIDLVIESWKTRRRLYDTALEARIFSSGS